MQSTLDRTQKTRLRILARTYETADFLDADPAQFMHRYTDVRDQEVMAFLAANLAFGRREQILLQGERIAQAASHSPADWIQSGAYKKLFAPSHSSFYRMYSHQTMRDLCGRLKELIDAHGTLGAAFRWHYEKACLESQRPLLSTVIAECFPARCTIIAHGAQSARKRLQMFLRWMVRDNSPVDMGLWTAWYDKKDLLIPLDTHVMQQAVAFGLLPRSESGHIPAPSLKIAIALTDTLRQVFPDDPVRGDFALFGSGVNNT